MPDQTNKTTPTPILNIKGAKTLSKTSRSTSLIKVYSYYIIGITNNNLMLLQYNGYLMIIYNILGIEIGLSLKAFNEQKEKLLIQEDRLLDLERRLNLCKYLNYVKEI